MRVRVGLIVALVLLAGVAVLASRGDSRPAHAQSAEPRPLLVNEVSDWCESTGPIDGSPCDQADYTVRPDGSLHVVFNYFADGGRLDDDQCVTGLAIPSDVQGWGYVIADDRRGMVPVDQIPGDAAVCELVVKRVS